MDGRRPAEGVTDSALAREIEAALAVDPSPEFVAKVRARVANEAAPASWWQLRWPVLASVITAAVVVFSTAALLWGPSTPEQVTARRGNDIALTAPPVNAEVGGEPTRTPRVRVAPTTTPRPSSGPRQPDVLISADEQRAFAMLVAAVQEGRFQRAVAASGNATDTPDTPMDITVAPLVIEPLPQIARLEGAGQ